MIDKGKGCKSKKSVPRKNTWESIRIVVHFRFLFRWAHFCLRIRGSGRSPWPPRENVLGTFFAYNAIKNKCVQRFSSWFKADLLIKQTDGLSFWGRVAHGCRFWAQQGRKIVDAIFLFDLSSYSTNVCWRELEMLGTRWCRCGAVEDDVLLNARGDDLEKMRVENHRVYNRIVPCRIVRRWLLEKVQ